MILLLEMFVFGWFLGFIKKCHTMSRLTLARTMPESQGLKDCGLFALEVRTKFWLQFCGMCCSRRKQIKLGRMVRMDLGQGQLEIPNRKNCKTSWDPMSALFCHVLFYMEPSEGPTCNQQPFFIVFQHGTVGWSEVIPRPNGWPRTSRMRAATVLMANCKPCSSPYRPQSRVEPLAIQKFGVEGTK